MKKKLKTATIILIPVIVIGLALIAAADPRNSGAGPLDGERKARRAMLKERLADKLDLTEEQRERIDDIHYQADMKKIDIKADLEKTRLEIKREMDQENINKEKVLDLTEEAGKLQTELRKIQIGARIDAHEVLTPEQREEARELKEKFKGMRRRWKERGMGREGEERESMRRMMMRRNEGRGMEHGMMGRRGKTGEHDGQGPHGPRHGDWDED